MLKYKINLDDYIAKKIIENIFLFKYIHPNIISLFSIILNFCIYKLLYSNNNNIYLFSLFLLLRWLSDLLDGAVARKYNKLSKLGHYLDTLSDIMLIIIIFNFILQSIFGYPFVLNMIIISLLIIYLFTKYNMLETHKNLKKYNNNFFECIIPFLTNNSYITFLFILLIYLYKK